LFNSFAVTKESQLAGEFLVIAIMVTVAAGMFVMIFQVSFAPLTFCATAGGVF
jgi:hypothetical protein